MEHEAAFIAAIQSGDSDSALGLLDATPELANAHNEAGLSALLLATYYGRREIVDAISDRRDLDLYEAAALGNDVQAQTLLNMQPELIDAANVDGFTPLGLAAYFGNLEVVDLLLGFGATVDLPARNDDAVTPLHSAAASNQTAIAQLLIDHGADVNARQQGGSTALHAAAQNGNHALVATLLAHGADAAAATDAGQTALTLAEAGGHDTVLALLA